MDAIMLSDAPEGTLLVTVGTRGICVFAWDGLTKEEIEDALEAIQEFVTFKRTNTLMINGERTGKRITLRTIHTPAMMDQGKLLVVSK